MTDAELRADLLLHFYELRHSNGGEVPVTDMVIRGTEQSSRGMIAGVCWQLADVGWIRWTDESNSENPIIGRAKLTALGVGVVERAMSNQIRTKHQKMGAPPEIIDVAWPWTRSKPGKAPSRQIIIAASDILKAPGHTGFDRMLLNFGLPDEIAGRGSGLKDRATALASYALQHPETETAEGETIADAIVALAVQIFRDTGAMSSNVSDTERRTFATLAGREGHSLETDGKIGEAPTIKPAEGNSRMTDRTTKASPTRKVFVVHGRDDGAKNEVELFLRDIGLEPIVLHKRPNKGRHILTKFEGEAEGVSFAVVLMTPDDEGGLVGGSVEKRARQNVIFELGFFIGKLGTPRVAALVKDIEKPSDFDGIMYIDLDAAGAWKKYLAREMKEADIPFDTDAVLTA